METPHNISENNYRVPAVDQAIRVLLFLSREDSSTRSLTDICQEVGIHRSKGYSILNTLHEYDLVKKYPNRRGYGLGTGLLTLAGKMLENLSLPRLVEPILNDLAKKAGATVTLGVISEDKTYIVAEFEGAPGIGISSPIGSVSPITYGAHGKAIAAFLNEKALAELLQTHQNFFYGSPARFDSLKFKNEIDECRQKGYALELGDIHPGVNVVAAPLLGKSGQPIGYITLAGFFTEIEAHILGPQAVEAVQKIARESDTLIAWKKTVPGNPEILR
jgi:DNA-binding IclR family transcriptional regulator